MPDYDIIVSKRIDDPGYRWRLRDGRTGVIDYDKVQTLIDALTADNPDSVKLRLTRDLTDAVAQRAAGAHAATFLKGRIGEPGVTMDDDGVLIAWDYDPANPQEHIVVSEADLATAICKHCGRSISYVNGAWVDTEATGDDAVWRETCDSHDTRTAEHEPADEGYEDMSRRALTASLTDAERGAANTLAERVTKPRPNAFYPLFATCKVCKASLQFDIDPDGTPGRNGDWGADGDYGCITGDDEGCDGHTPVNIRWEPNTEEPAND
jgi:hypothetical protein